MEAYSDEVSSDNFNRCTPPTPCTQVLWQIWYMWFLTRMCLRCNRYWCTTLSVHKLNSSVGGNYCLQIDCGCISLQSYLPASIVPSNIFMTNYYLNQDHNPSLSSWLNYICIYHFNGKGNISFTNKIFNFLRTLWQESLETL